MVPTIPKPIYWKSEQNGSHFVAIFFQFPMIMDKMAAILFKMEHPRKTERHWNSKSIQYSCPNSILGVWYLDLRCLVFGCLQYTC